MSAFYKMKDLPKRIYRRLKKPLAEWHYRYCVDHCPKRIIEKSWLKEFGYPIDWDHPRDINEKIQWLIAFSDTTEWSRLTDKYLVRDYVKSKGYGENLAKLYGVWEKAEDINFDALPEKFVLKCNHDSGSYCIVDKQKGYGRDGLVKKIDKFLRRKYGYQYCEPHYNRINPLVIAEEFLKEDNSFSFSLVDYKVWCFNGKPESILVCYDRDHSGISVNVYDLNWQVHPEFSVITDYYRDGHGIVPKPSCLSEMLAMASDLSVGFPEVRIDFYIVKEKPIFGEMTFTSMTGRMKYYTNTYLNLLGSRCDLSIAKRV